MKGAAEKRDIEKGEMSIGDERKERERERGTKLKREREKKKLFDYQCATKTCTKHCSDDKTGKIIILHAF